MSEEQVEGWDLDETSNSSESLLEQHGLALLIKPINFLQQSYPLEPDMMFGWRPKLPLSPVPLSYRNDHVDWLVGHLNSFGGKQRLVYLGPRLSNSVKVNQQYQYQWKSRSKYNLNVGVLRERIQQVGGGAARRILRPPSCNYKFSSAFQGGNLDAVVAASADEFDCFIRSDSNTQGHCNWYYFTVEAEQPGRCRINICNITKHASLYGEGMRPYVNDGYGWRQAGEEVAFQEQRCRYGSDALQHRLQFTYDFRLPQQKVEFAYCIPYSYSRLEKFVEELKQSHPKRIVCESLTDSLGGVSLPLLTISNGQQSPSKRLVLVTARIHPGQSSSSFMLEGFVRGLLERPQLAGLLQEFDFKIVPMLNPDGVIIGNFRTSYSGKDLNRQFYTTNKLVYPEICALNELAVQLKQLYKHRFEYYFDMHNHSTRTGLFCYGPEHQRWSSYYLRCRAFAKLLERSDQMFNYRNSIFTISEHKRTTGRARMFSNLQVPYTYTFELSNGFYESVTGKLIPLEQTDMMKAGQIVLEGLYSFEIVHKASMTVLHTATIGNARRKELSSATPLKNRSTMKALKTDLNICGRANKQTSIERRAKSSKRRRLATPTQPDVSCQTINNQFFNSTTQQPTVSNTLEELMNDIKKETQQEAPLDGGSDSQPSNEDLSKEELGELHNQLQHRELTYQQDAKKPETAVRLKKKSSNRYAVTTKSIQNQTVRRPASTLRYLQRSETARLQRYLVKKPAPEKYLLAPKHFVMNL